MIAMSDSYEEDTMRLGEDPNPEGFPCCPKCGEFVALTKDKEHYYCGECDYTFSLDKAESGSIMIP